MAANMECSHYCVTSYLLFLTCELGGLWLEPLVLLFDSRTMHVNANRCQYRVVWLVSAASRRRRTLWPSSKRISLWICTFYSSPFSLQTTSCTKVLHVIFGHTIRSRQTSRSQHFSWKTKLRPHQPTSHYSHFLRLRVRFIFLSSSDCPSCYNLEHQLSPPDPLPNPHHPYAIVASTTTTTKTRTNQH